MLRNFFAREDAGRQMEGQTLVEYALILVLISIVAIITMTALGVRVDAIFGEVTDALTP